MSRIRKEQFEEQLKSLQQDILTLSQKLVPTKISERNGHFENYEGPQIAESSSASIYDNAKIEVSREELERMQEEHNHLKDQVILLKKDKEDLSNKLSEAVKENEELRRNLIEYGKLKALYDHLKQDFASVQISLESSERIRKQQKDLIHLLQQSSPPQLLSLNSNLSIPQIVPSIPETIQNSPAITHHQTAELNSQGIEGIYRGTDPIPNPTKPSLSSHSPSQGAPEPISFDRLAVDFHPLQQLQQPQYQFSVMDRILNRHDPRDMTFPLDNYLLRNPSISDHKSIAELSVGGSHLGNGHSIPRPFAREVDTTSATTSRGRVSSSHKKRKNSLKSTTSTATPSSAATILSRSSSTASATHRREKAQAKPTHPSPSSNGHSKSVAAARPQTVVVPANQMTRPSSASSGKHRSVHSAEASQRRAPKESLVEDIRKARSLAISSKQLVAHKSNGRVARPGSAPISGRSPPAFR